MQEVDIDSDGEITYHYADGTTEQYDSANKKINLEDRPKESIDNKEDDHLDKKASNTDDKIPTESAKAKSSVDTPKVDTPKGSKLGKAGDVLGKVVAIGSIGGNVLDHYDPSLVTKIENWAPIKWLGDEWDDLADSKFGSDVGSVVDYLANHTYVGSFVGNVLDGVGGFYSGSYKAIADFGESFWDGIVEGNMKAATQDMDNLGTDLHNAVHSIGNAVENTVSDFCSVAKEDIESWF